MNKIFITILACLTIALQGVWSQFNFEWAGAFQSSGAANAQKSLMVTSISNGVDIDATGNVYTTGYFQNAIDFDPAVGSGSVLTSNGGASDDIFICKLDALGNFEWARGIGGIGDDQGQDIHVDSNNDIIITGRFSSTVDFDPGSNVFNMTAVGTRDIFILKLNAAGDFIWAVQMGGVSPEIGFSITTDANNNIYTTGAFESGAIDLDPSAGTNIVSSQGGEDMFVQKLDPNGNYLWAHAFGGTGDDVGNGITTDAAGNVYICGEFQAMVDFDPSIPITLTGTAQAGTDGYVLKLDPNGNYVWVQLYACSGNAQPFGIEVDANSDVVVGGYFEGSLDIDPSLNTNNFASNGGIDGFVQKLDSNGGLVWANQFGGTAADGCLDLTLDNTGNVYVSGIFQNTIDLDPGAGTFNLTANGSFDGFVQKLNPNGDHLWAYQIGSPFSGTSSFVSLRSIAVDNAENIITTGFFQSIIDFDPTPGNFSLSAGGINFGHVEKMSQGACSNTFATDVQSACDTYTWIDGNTYTTSNNTATHTLVNAAGCDSLVTLDLTITSGTTSIDVQTACGSYTWIDGNTYTASNNTATFTLPNAAGCDSVITLDLTINTVTTTTSTTDFTITADAQGASYQWIDCDNNNAPITGETGQSFTATANGNYAVIVTENGCSDTSTCVAITTISLEEIDPLGMVQMYPNPTSGNVLVQLSESMSQVRIKVVDNSGRLVSEKEYTNAAQMHVELGNANGLYLVTVITKDRVHTGRIVKNE